MLNSLIRLLDDSNLDYLQNRISEGLERLKKTFGGYFTTLEDKGESYELVLDVAEDANASNVTVDYDEDTRELQVNYTYDGKNFKSTSRIVEVLPDDADDETIEASVEDGQLVVKIEKLLPEEEPVDEPVDETVVKVNRKKK